MGFFVCRWFQVEFLKNCQKCISHISYQYCFKEMIQTSYLTPYPCSLPTKKLEMAWLLNTISQNAVGRELSDEATSIKTEAH